MKIRIDREFTGKEAEAYATDLSVRAMTRHVNEVHLTAVKVNGVAPGADVTLYSDRTLSRDFLSLRFTDVRDIDEMIETLKKARTLLDTTPETTFKR